MSWPQQQIGFKQSRKLCLNLWSLRWLKPNLSLVISFIPIGLWQLKVLLGVRSMNCKMLFLKRAMKFVPNFGKYSKSRHCTKYEVFHSSFLRIWSHFLEKSLMEDYIFCAVRQFTIKVYYQVFKYCDIIDFFISKRQFFRKNFVYE